MKPEHPIIKSCSSDCLFGYKNPASSRQSEHSTIEQLVMQATQRESVGLNVRSSRLVPT